MSHRTLALCLSCLLSLVLLTPVEGQQSSSSLPECRGRGFQGSLGIQLLFASENDKQDTSLDDDHSGGGYELHGAQGGPRSQSQMMMGLEELFFPAGTRSYFSAKWGKIRLPAQRGELQRAGDPHIPDLKEDEWESQYWKGNQPTSHQWCARTIRGPEGPGIVFRGGLVMDNWGSSSVLKMGPITPPPAGPVYLCEIIGEAPFITTDCYDYEGIPLRPQYVPGSGYPSAHYEISNWRQAEWFADRIYESAGEAKAGGYSSYDFELYGSIRRRPHPDPPDGCDDFLGTGLFGDPCPDWMYERTLKGRLWVRTYHDPRIDTRTWTDSVAGRGSGGQIHSFAVQFTDVFYEDSWEVMERWESYVRQLCGSEQGCSPGVEVPAPDSAQFIKMADAQERRLQMCRARARRSNEMTVDDCTINEDNQYIGDMEPDEQKTDSILNSDPDLPDLSEAEKDSTFSGQRGDKVGPSPSQFDRICRRAIHRDSVRRADSPVETEPLVPTICESYLPGSADSTSSTASVSATTTSSPAAQQLSQECQRVQERWQAYDADGLLPEGKTWRDYVPERCLTSDSSS